MKANEVRKLSAAELDAKLVELKKDLFNLRLQPATNQLFCFSRQRFSV